MSRVVAAEGDRVPNMINRRHINGDPVHRVASVDRLVFCTENPRRVPFVQGDSFLEHSVLIPIPCLAGGLTNGVAAGVVIHRIHEEMQGNDRVASELGMDRINASERLIQVLCRQITSCAVVHVIVVKRRIALTGSEFNRLAVNGVNRQVEYNGTIALTGLTEDICVIAGFGQSFPCRHGVVLLVRVRGLVVADRFIYIHLNLVQHGDIIRGDGVASVLYAGGGVVVLTGDRCLFAVYTIGIGCHLRTAGDRQRLA